MESYIEYMEYIEKQKKVLYKKEKWLKAAMEIDVHYHSLNPDEREYVEAFIFDVKSKIGIKRTYESLGGRFGAYFILRLRNRLASEILELMVLVMSSNLHWVEKCRSNDRRGDIKINGVKYDIKLQFDEPNEEGRLMPKEIRDYNQRKIFFLFPREKKSYIYNNFVEYFRNDQQKFMEIAEGFKENHYREVVIEDMDSISYYC